MKTPEEQYVALRRKQVEALKHIYPGHRTNFEPDRQYSEAGDEAARIAREHDFSWEKCVRLNTEAGLMDTGRVKGRSV